MREEKKRTLIKMLKTNKLLNEMENRHGNTTDDK